MEVTEVVFVASLNMTKRQPCLLNALDGSVTELPTIG